MTGPEHYREAERLINEARTTAKGFTPNPPQSYAQKIAEAQVHAMLALATATGVSDDGREWQSVAGSKFSG